MPKAKRTPIDLTADEITVWTERVAGWPVTKIAERHEMPESTVYDWLKRAETAIPQVINIEELREALYTLFPEAVEAIRYTLRIKKDGNLGLKLLTGLAILVDKQQIDYTDKTATPGQLRQRITEFIDQRTKKAV